MMTKIRFLLLAITLAPALAIGQEQRGPWVWSVAGGALHQADADLDGTDGAFSVNRGTLELSAGYAWDRQTSVSLSLGAGSSNYIFDSDARIDGDKPWGRIED